MSGRDSGEASRLAQASWALYDWAAQPYHTLIITFVFLPYFVTGFVGDPIRGQAIVGYTLGTAGFLVALTSPLAGAIADAIGRRKPWILFFSIVFVPAISLLWFAEPGATTRLPFIIGTLMVSAFCIEFAFVFYNAMLPSIAPQEKIGGLSGYAWGLGYIGGLIALTFVLIYLALPGEMNAPMIPDKPLFGLDMEKGEPDRMTGPITGLWYLIFTLPLFLYVPEKRAEGVSLRAAIGDGAKQLLGTLKNLPKYRNILHFLVARMIYNDGLLAVFSFGGIYAASLFGWSITTMGIFGITLIIFSAVGAFAGGWLDQQFGSKPTLFIALAFLLVGMLGILTIREDSILFVVGAPSLDQDTPPLSTLQEQFYLICGILLGMAAGPIQAASRTMMARLAPPDMITEFFGLYAFSGRCTAFAAPLTIAVTTQAFNSQLAGIVVIFVFVLVGTILLIPVHETPKEHPNP